MPPHIKHARILHYLLLPAILIGSDIFIGFLGHFSGSTGNNYTIEGFIEYIRTMNFFTDLLPVLIIAIGIVFLVEHIVRKHKKKPHK